jgi:hypothetical protein
MWWDYTILWCHLAQKIFCLFANYAKGMGAEKIVQKSDKVKKINSGILFYNSWGPGFQNVQIYAHIFEY